jgi:hypothetical protein
MIERINPPPPDRLGAALLQSLARPVEGGGSWGVVRTIFLSIVTLGLLPLISWPRRFRDLVMMEQQQFWHLAEWLRLRNGGEEAQRLRKLAERMRFRWELWALSLLCIGGIIFVFASQLHWGLTLRDVLASTYGFGRGRHGDTGLPYDVAQRMFAAWTVGLFLAYMIHWVQIQWRALDVERFVRQYNRLALMEGLRAIDVPRVGWGGRPLWMAGAVLLVLFGALWGIPLMLAGAVQRNYAGQAVPRVREGLAHGVRDMLVGRRPAEAVPVPVRLLQRCGTERCAAPLPYGAKYCPRCGAPVG